MHEPAKILIADDDQHIRRILEFLLDEAGYRVVTASNGQEAISQVVAERPDLVLLDVMMPHLDGFAVLEHIRQLRGLQRLPVIMLTARGESVARVRGFRGGANDYVSKPFDQEELLARVANMLETVQAQREANPLTGLPGNHAIEREMARRLREGGPFAAMYLDIDRFKRFNDHYGYARGDLAIELVADTIGNVVDGIGSPDDFIGHVGGDDFLVLCDSGQADAIAGAIVEAFERDSEGLHDPEDLARGYLEISTRTGERVHAPLITLTVALITDVPRRYNHPVAVSDALAELKRHGKQQPGSVVVKERRAPDASTEMISLDDPGQSQDT
ncbi:response regulator [bacterium]|nr:response regulator [bacterium]